MIDVSVIIVNYNTCQITKNCIDSVVEKTKDVEYEIILVDNASTDGSKEIFEKDNRITYIYSEKNGGFGYGNNIGMKAAKGKYIFLLNSDTLFVNNAIKEFYDYAELHEDMNIYGCYLQHNDGSYCISFFDFPSFTIKEFFTRLFFKKKEIVNINKCREVDVISGADMFINNKIIKKTGGFDENIFLNGEESELQYRMKKFNIKRYILPTPKIIHLEGVSQKKAKINYHYSKGHFITLKLHMAKFTYYLTRVYYFLRYCLVILKNPFDKNYWRYLKLSLTSIEIDSRLSRPHIL